MMALVCREGIWPREMGYEISMSGLPCSWDRVLSKQVRALGPRWSGECRSSQVAGSGALAIARHCNRREHDEDPDTPDECLPEERLGWATRHQRSCCVYDHAHRLVRCKALQPAR